MNLDETAGRLLSFSFGSFVLEEQAYPTPSPIVEGTPQEDYVWYTLTATGGSADSFAGCTGAEFTGENDEENDGPGGSRVFSSYSGVATLMTKMEFGDLRPIVHPHPFRF